MQIKYSRHIETRIALRKIEYDLPMAAEEKAAYGNKPKKKKGRQYSE